MSSLHKFENKFIDHTTKDELRSYLSNAKKELLKVHKACNFDESVSIITDRDLIQVSLVAPSFSLIIRHGETEHKTEIKLFENLSYVKNISLSNLHNEKFISELIHIS